MSRRKPDAADKLLKAVPKRKATPIEVVEERRKRMRRVAIETIPKRRKYGSDEEAKEVQKARSLKQARKIVQYQRDIGSIQLDINWERRLEAKQSLRAFCEIYLKQMFFMSWSADQLYAIDRAESVCKQGGKYAFTMPRAGGKTAICRAAVLWSTLFGYKHFVFNVGSTEDKATATLSAVKTHLCHNPLLHVDFPEVCWPVVCLQGTNRTAGSQLFLGEPTHVYLGTEEIRYPSILFPKEYVDYYGEHDKSSIIHIPHLDTESNAKCYVGSNCLVLLRCSGITGSIRGEAEAHPITLEQPRPDLVLLDDVQKDAVADSPLMCEKMIRLLDGAVTGLSQGGKHIDALMPCTVIREDDVADTYTNPLKKPEWQGRKFRMVNTWPEGITDYEITYDSPAGKHWNQYAELRRVSLRDEGHWQPATDYYTQNRQEMDDGFEVSWAERFDARNEISPQQHAMNLRLQLGPMFLSEYQNIGRQLLEAAPILITADQLQKKTIEYEHATIPPTHQHLVAFLDIQDEIFFYTVFSCDSDFNGTFIDYGTFPKLTTNYFTKSQTYSWSLLTSEFFKEQQHQKLRHLAIRNDQGKVRAPFEAKIYYALQKVVPALLSRQYTRIGQHQKTVKIQRLGIDTRWGQASEVIKRYIREAGFDNVIPYYGQALPPTNRQLEEYERREGWYFENMQHANVREPKWVIRPSPDGTWYMMADVNRLKDFLFQRLGTPLGGAGSISLHTAPKDYHELFCHHICSSEYPEPVAARGIIKNQWTVREGVSFDNDYLDCAAGCMALASFAGASLKTSDYETPIITRRLSTIANRKRKERDERRNAEKILTTERNR